MLVCISPGARYFLIVDPYAKVLCSLMFTVEIDLVRRTIFCVALAGETEGLVFLYMMMIADHRA